MNIKYFLLSLLVAFLFSCSETSKEESLEINIFDGSYDTLNFSIDDFINISFKINKEYDISELPDAIEAYYGFWGSSDYERREFELRFYPSNEIAKSSGTFFAEEATGEDAIIKKADATWKEGVKDRRFVGPFGTSKNRSKYLDYVIFGNVIVLCPSEVSEKVIGAWDPIENCKNMLSKLIIN
ncbi:MAG: hypothetical protein CL907_01935 [Dehalococcoidia bacterium]|nr:hypothetical protein [Dehalococcoidia bacterium]MQG04145.1 hypothetical protein [SAR202 cluster bacterium]|tara:strand:+ start:184 stop:732 length:549 start_codon:yes stop_codon:yes gene_type:complete